MLFSGTGGGTGNLATVNDEDKNTDLKLLLEMAYPFKGRAHRYFLFSVLTLIFLDLNYKK